MPRGRPGPVAWLLGCEGHALQRSAEGKKRVKRDKSKPASLTVLIAFAANVLVAAAKTVAALISGSASMTAEAAHSWATQATRSFWSSPNGRPPGSGTRPTLWATDARRTC